jgi:hypothetical protein
MLELIDKDVVQLLTIHFIFKHLCRKVNGTEMTKIQLLGRKTTISKQKHFIWLILCDTNKQIRH